MARSQSSWGEPFRKPLASQYRYASTAISRCCADAIWRGANLSQTLMTLWITLVMIFPLTQLETAGSYLHQFIVSYDGKRT
jgi:hypothetical protein